MLDTLADWEPGFAIAHIKGLAAWYGLYKTREPACYFTFMQEVGGGGPA